MFNPVGNFKLKSYRSSTFLDGVSNKSSVMCSFTMNILAALNGRSLVVFFCVCVFFLFVFVLFCFVLIFFSIRPLRCYMKQDAGYGISLLAFYTTQCHTIHLGLS